MKQKRAGEAILNGLRNKAWRFVQLSLVVMCLVSTQGWSAAAQSLTVSGTVKGADGYTIPGVSVVIKGTTNGVSTDVDGKYGIVVSSSTATLVFTSVGMKTQEVAVDGKTTIDVTLANDALALDELIVVGYGTMKKSDLSGSVTRANITSFQDQPNTSITQALQGTVAGLNVGTTTGAGAAPSITIRGQNSFSGSTSPLIVLDGIIYNGSILDINPNDIESVDVLKDASSKAIYGSRAANGVMMVTTKSGKNSSKPKFTVSSYYTISNPAKTFTPLKRDAYIAKVGDVYWDEAYEGPDYLTPVAGFDPTPYWMDQITREGYADGTDTDWVDLVTQTPYLYNFNVGMAGTTDNTSYYISAGYTDEAAYVKNDNYSKINIRVNFENKVAEWLTVGMQSFVSSSDYSGVAADLRGAMIYSPLIKPYNEDGSLNFQGNAASPLSSLDIQNNDKRLNLAGTFTAKISIPAVKGLSYNLNYSVNYRTNRYASFDPYGETTKTAEASQSSGAALDQTIDNIISYNNTFNDLHSVNATLLYGYEERKYESFNASVYDFINPALGYNALGKGNVDNQRVGSSAWDQVSMYQMGRLNYKYDDKYIVTGTVRRDGFSGFGSANKFGVFPSVALAWIATNEDFVSVPAISHLKGRVSYGSNGNTTVGRYQTLAKSGGSYQYLFGDGANPAYGQGITSMANDELGWETTKGVNFGVDFGILDNKLSGSIDYYVSNTYDILYQRPLPQVSGFSKISSNIGKVANRGLEITLNSVNVESEDFKWTSMVTFSRNRNEVRSVLGQDADEDGVEDDLISAGLFIGEPIGTIYSYVEDGFYGMEDGVDLAGQYKIKNLNPEDGDDISSAEDRTIIGYTDPSFRMGLLNEFTYKDFSLSIFLNTIQGGKNRYMASQGYEYGWRPGATMATFNSIEEFDYWTPGDTDATYATLTENSAVEPGFYRDRSFVRLQDMKISYNIPSEILSKYNIDNARVFVSGKNLATWTKWDGLDPETGTGLYPGASPVMKSYSFGLNLTF